MFERAFPRRFVRLRFPHNVTIDGETVRSTNLGVGPLEMATKLISAPAGAGQADGASDQPSANDSGGYVAYRTAADNLFTADTNRTTDIVRTNTLKGTTDLISRDSNRFEIASVTSCRSMISPSTIASASGGEMPQWTSRRPRLF